MCQKCRHEAAEARRLAAQERADQLRTHEEKPRRQREREEERRRERARQEEEARAQQQARQREEQERQRAEKARQREEDIRVAREIDVAPEAFDPYVVLGVTRNASKQEIDARIRPSRSTTQTNWAT